MIPDDVKGCLQIADKLERRPSIDRRSPLVFRGAWIKRAAVYFKRTIFLVWAKLAARSR